MNGTKISILVEEAPNDGCYRNGVETDGICQEGQGEEDAEKPPDPPTKAGLDTARD